MKDQYIADLGDYGKYSLLRAFLDAGVRVGINWYLTEDDGSNDGNFTDYLDDESEGSLRKYDPDVFETLKQIRKTDRTTHGVERSGLLAGVSFYNKRLDCSGTQQERKEKRRDWHSEAIEKLADCPLVFLDPDNGLRKDAKLSRNADKYVFPDEVRDYYHNTQNAVYYCHKGRRTAEEWERYKSIMPKRLPGAKPIVLTYRKGTRRSYIFLIHPKDYEGYREILDAFLKKWDGIFIEEQIEDPDISKYHAFASKWAGIFRREERIGWIFDSMEFAEEAWEAGFEMDSHYSFREVFPGSKACWNSTELKHLLETDNRMTAPLLGSMIFSYWRYLNHWSMDPVGECDREWFIIALEHLAKLTGQSG
ncbi:MAG: hypothetical protein IKZ95_03255 [Lachnospiraceae bacterium]|nr:hypothetical protein [Lachnospiraceae bacterium]